MGTDPMIKMIKYPENMELAAVVGIDENSEGLTMARSYGIATTHEGIEGQQRLACYSEIGIAFDATSAYASTERRSRSAMRVYRDLCAGSSGLTVR